MPRRTKAEAQATRESLLDAAERLFQARGVSRSSLQLIADGTFTHGDTETLRPLLDSLVFHDPFLVLADYASYIECQDRVDQAWKDRDTWSRMSILNAARSGKFSSDRSIREYCDQIWNVPPMNVRT